MCVCVCVYGWVCCVHACIRKLLLSSFTQLHFDSVILLIRSPFDAMVAERNRRLTLSTKMQVSGNLHTSTFNETYFMNDSNWKLFIKNHINKWCYYFKWMFDIPEGHTSLLIRYEDLKTNLIKEIRKILDFLHFKTTGIQMMPCSCTFKCHKNVHFLLTSLSPHSIPSFICSVYP